MRLLVGGVALMTTTGATFVANEASKAVPNTAGLFGRHNFLFDANEPGTAPRQVTRDPPLPTLVHMD